MTPPRCCCRNPPWLFVDKSNDINLLNFCFLELSKVPKKGRGCGSGPSGWASVLSTGGNEFKFYHQVDFFLQSSWKFLPYLYFTLKYWPKLTLLKALTKLLNRHQVCHRRHTWQSLREHFRKQIIPKLNSFKITSKQKQKFKDGWRGLPVRFSASF